MLSFTLSTAWQRVGDSLSNSQKAVVDIQATQNLGLWLLI